MKKIAVIIVAAGIGSRAGAGLPKPYRKIGETTVIEKTALIFSSHPKIDKVQVVIHHDHVDLYDELGLPAPVLGGHRRAESVHNGMKALAGTHTDYVLIHDAARPFLSHDVIDRVIDALETAQACIPAIPVADAIWHTKNGKLTSPIPRKDVVRAQTPQGFHYEAYAKICAEFPDSLDDAECAISAGLDVAWVDGDAQNVKLTFPEDFEAHND